MPPEDGASSTAGEGSPATVRRSSSAGRTESAGGGRHLVPDELVRAPTYRLTPDRVARAKVRQVHLDDDDSEDTTRLPSAVPRPRQS